MLNILLAILLFFTLCHAKAADNGSDDIPLKWLDIEVVTNQFEKISDIKKASRLRPGFTAAMSAPVLRDACARIRNAHPDASVNCHAILMEAATALYVVEFSGAQDIQRSKQAACRDHRLLSHELITMLENWQSTTKELLMSPGGAAISEYINDDRYLDYHDPELHRQALAIHVAIKQDISKAGDQAPSCMPTDRENLIYALNFLGDPEQALTIAASYLEDEDASVRNAAFRLQASFAKYVSPSSGGQLLRAACKNLRHELFTDRNKSLALIDGILSNNTVKSDIINQQCREMIQKSAEYNVSEQIGGNAKRILKLLD